MSPPAYNVPALFNTCLALVISRSRRWRWVSTAVISGGAWMSRHARSSTTLACSRGMAGFPCPGRLRRAAIEDHFRLVRPAPPLAAGQITGQFRRRHGEDAIVVVGNAFKRGDAVGDAATHLAVPSLDHCI